MTTSTARSLYPLSKELETIFLNVHQSTKGLTVEKAKVIQSLYLETTQRFKDILNAINAQAKEPIQDASIGIVDVEDPKDENRLVWEGAMLIFNGEYFDAGENDIWDIDDLKIHFPDNKVPDEIRAMIKELIEFSANIPTPICNTRLIANLESASVEFTPTITNVDFSVNR